MHRQYVSGETMCASEQPHYANKGNRQMPGRASIALFALFPARQVQRATFGTIIRGSTIAPSLTTTRPSSEMVQPRIGTS